MARPRLLVFASGSKNGGGSGFEKMAEASRNEILDADIVAVVSNHLNGGVRERALRLAVPFSGFDGIWTRLEYKSVVQFYKPDFIALSGWLKQAVGLDPRITFNVHPGPLPWFGGKGMYGHHVHEAVLRAYLDARKEDEEIRSAVSMHFVTEEYDQGPVFFRIPVTILPTDTPETLGQRVNWMEHYFQPRITNLVCQGQISWDGVDPKSLRLPEGYQFLRNRLE
ncbi:MAG: formyltransferase family protein [Candidatus Staskawiczbacteria bacterium]|nr:formyltransferase family protein [Candidatus Staskawiczbacteria bacterium]